MILLTKLDQTPVVINLESIKYIEAIPDTLVLFVNGDSLIVREPLDEVQRRAAAFQARVLELSQKSEYQITAPDKV